MGRPSRLPFCRAWASPARVRSLSISLSNSAYCGEPQYLTTPAGRAMAGLLAVFADYAECAIMQSHSAEMAVWPAFQ